MNTTNRSLFQPSKETLLTRGLNSMTLACDALADKVKALEEENIELKVIINRLETKILENRI
jgi:hypothetical protein